ncbi:MAG: sulfatase/phosphatase domain-containing protein [Bacteroidota bacterium]
MKIIHFYYDVDEWVMYDLEEDPDEIRNIYNDPTYSEVRERLLTKLEELHKQYGDSDELKQHFLDEYLSRRNQCN